MVNDPNAIPAIVGVGLLGILFTTLAAQYFGLLSILEALMGETRRALQLTVQSLLPSGAGPLALLSLLGFLLLPFLWRRRRRGAPAAPRVTRSDSDPMHALDVAWDGPSGNGTRYDVQYRAPGGDWIAYARTNLTWIELSALEPSVRYSVRIRKRNGDLGPWSAVGIGHTDGEGDSDKVAVGPPQLRARNDAGTSFGD